MPIVYGQVWGRKNSNTQPLPTKRCVLCDEEKLLTEFNMLGRSREKVCNGCKQAIESEPDHSCFTCLHKKKPGEYCRMRRLVTAKYFKRKRKCRLWEHAVQKEA